MGWSSGLWPVDSGLCAVDCGLRTVDREKPTPGFRPTSAAEEEYLGATTQDHPADDRQCGDRGRLGDGSDIGERGAEADIIILSLCT